MSQRQPDRVALSVHSYRRPTSLSARLGWPLALALMAMAWPVAAMAQPAAPATPGNATLELDILAMLRSEQLFPEQAEDGIWLITPAAGRRLVQLPVEIKPGDSDAEFAHNTVRLTAGRYIAWRTVDAESEKALEGSDAARQIESERLDMPTFTRSFILTTQGRVQWKMERFLSGGELKVPDPVQGVPDRLYAYRISRKLLSDAAPKPPRITREAGESAAAHFNRSAMATNEYRIAREMYTQMRQQVEALPDTFDIDAPRRVWGVFDLLMFERNLEVTGTSHPTWRIGLSQLDTLREASKSTMQSDAQLPSATLLAMVQVANDPHPYSQRLVAYTLSLSGAVGSVRPNDTLYNLLAKLMNGPDAPARRVVIKEVASVLPPTPATLALLKDVAKIDLDPRSRLETLRGMLSIDLSQPTVQSRDAIGNLNQSLRDPQGPSPQEILAQVIQTTQEQPQSTGQFAAGVQFAGLPAERMDQAILFVVQHAGSSPLAAQWLDQQFLGAADLALVARTLEVISQAKVSDTPAEPASPDATQPAPAAGTASPLAAGLSRLLGSAANTSQAGDATAAPASGVVQLNAPIIVPGTNHNLFRTLRSSDERVRTLAWLALSRFAFVPRHVLEAQHQQLLQQQQAYEQQRQQEAMNQPSANRPATPAQPGFYYPQGDAGVGTAPAATPGGDAMAAPTDSTLGQGSRYQLLVDIALQQNPTPTAAAAFLAKQPESDKAAVSLTQLVLRGSSDAAALASRLLLALHTPMEPVFQQLPFGERAGLAARLYEYTTGQAPLTTSLLRQRQTNNPLVGWFARQVSEGTLPAPSQWASAASSDAALIELIGSSDPDVGLAAVAALVYQAGGQDRDAVTIARALRNLADQSVSNLTTEWNAAKRKLYFEQLKQIAGPYQLVLQRGPQQHLLGVVQFQSDGQSVRFGNQAIDLSVPDDRLVLRLDTPAQLKSLGQLPELTDLPLDNTPAIELASQNNGDWAGRIHLPDGYEVTVLILRPLAGQ